jgi:hypothetical protein
LPAARDGAGNPIEVVGAWSDVTARKQLAEALAAAQERLVHLLSCDIEREPAGVAQLAAAGSSLDRHEIAARPATSASDQRPRKHPCRDRSSNANSLQGQNSDWIPGNLCEPFKGIFCQDVETNPVPLGVRAEQITWNGVGSVEHPTSAASGPQAESLSCERICSKRSNEIGY